MLIQDIDFMLSNYKTKKFMFVELKTKWAEVTFPQRQMYNMLHKRLTKTNWSDGWEYVWTNLIKFYWEDFNQTVEMNWEFINEYELLDFLNKKLWNY